MALKFWHHFFTAQFLAKEQRHISRAAKVIKTTTIIISPATVLYGTSELTSYSKFQSLGKKQKNINLALSLGIAAQITM